MSGVMRLAVLLACGSGSAFGTAWHVDASAPAGGDGLSWSGAFRSPHAALSAAQAGDEIRVAQGVYKPAGPGGDRSATFALKTDVVVRGGYAGRASVTPDARDPAVFVTVWSGDLNGDDGAAFLNRGDNSRHVATLDLGTVPTLVYLGEAVLDGLVLRGGMADSGSGALDRGGGLRAIAPEGPGLEAAARLTVRGCRFEDSWALRGGGVHTTNIVPRFEGCVFEGNFAITGGGVEHLFQAFFFERPSAEFVRCDFVGNTGSSGGGLAHMGQRVVVESCSFLGNVADFGAGFLTPSCEEALIVNGLFAGNSGVSGVAVFDDGSRTTTLVNCTLTGNVGTSSSSSSFLSGTMIESRAHEMFALRNCVVWGNAGAQPQIQSFFLEVSHCDVEGGAPGVGNIAEDPGFVSAAGGDFRLRPHSACADSGDTGALPAGVSADLAGRARVVDDALAAGKGVDMGAYERQVCPGDATGDLRVGFADLNTVLGMYGQAGVGLLGDVDGDGAVGFADLNIVLAAFGVEC